MTDLAIASAGLTKAFGHQVVVDNIDLVVPRGAIYGFLGPNGSGKTTTIRMLLGLIRATDGSSTVLGRPVPLEVDKVLPRIGALVEGPAFHPYLSGRANLVRLDSADRYSDARTVRSRVASALERVGLSAAASKTFRAYSLGMKQRLAIAACLLQPRELLILDEPTNGLDPQGTREVRHLVASLAEGGATVLISSHLLSEVEQVCTHVGVMNRGKLVAQDKLGSLRSAASVRIELQTPDAEQALGVLVHLGVTDARVSDRSVWFSPGSLPPENVVAALVAHQVRVAAFNVTTPTLEDLFVGLTGEGFDVGA